MRAPIFVLISLVGLLAIAGMASAQNNPCPECDPDGEPADNSYHSVDAGLIDGNATTENAEALVDTDVAYNHDPEDEKGFYTWISICLSAFVDYVEDIVGIHTDVDAHVEVYSDSEGTDVDASVTGLQYVCGAANVNMTCDYDFDDSELGDADGMTYEAIAAAEATTGVDVWVPAVLPDTDDTDTDLCVHVDLQLCG